jgi:hypothetical protein
LELSIGEGGIEHGVFLSGDQIARNVFQSAVSLSSRLDVNSSCKGPELLNFPAKIGSCRSDIRRAIAAVALASGIEI